MSNRIANTVNGTSSNYTYDDNDRITDHGLDTYSYDDNGNTISEVVNGQSNSYTYDSQNRLIEATMGGVVQAMAYDLDGVRIQKSTNGDTTDYLTDSNRDYAQVLYERSATSELKYTFGTDLVGLSTRVDNFTYHTDALGSTRLLTNGEGDVADDVRYDAWGEVLSGGDVGENQYLYTGEQFDGGLRKTYLRARYYDAGVGRFPQMNDYLGNAGSPVTIHKYLYGNVDHQNNLDPSGQYSLIQYEVASAALGSLLTIATTNTMKIGDSNSLSRDSRRPTNYVEIGLLVLATMAASNASLFDLLGLKRRARQDDECGYLPYGPFYRYEFDAALVVQALSGWMYGTTPRGGYWPTVQANNSRNLKGSNDVKFCTAVEPAKNGDPIRSHWYPDTPGVVPHDDETIKIPIKVVD